MKEFQPLDYTKTSPISYVIKKPEKKYVIFTGSYSKGWKLGNQEPIKETVNFYENKGYTDLTYKRFKVYLISYIVSLMFFAILLYKLKKNSD